ncbi:hypothetical protein HZS_8004 [Henneguya salminicola]|nr:hypothetical protein HZS_8004 [Henneguya salminicola]
MHLPSYSLFLYSTNHCFNKYTNKFNQSFFLEIIPIDISCVLIDGNIYIFNGHWCMIPEKVE